ncbi:MAG: type II secretion system F family protein [Candidatus Thalassarchaeaceae archaeon]|jgi:flagellar protein FlaJ|nr:type II secretion system F family protein [Candidatus Thalassarchaeaceae archaeon]
MEDKLSTWQIALLRLGMPFSRYLLFISLPAVILGLVAGLTVWYSVSDAVGPVGAAGLILTFPLVSFAATIAYPVTQVSAEAIQIEQDMHMFMTRMGILSLGESAEKGMFDVLKEMGDYGALAHEIQAIETLVTKWHTNLPEAARIIGRQSPSEIWSDFLDRMAFSVEVGQPIGEFFKSENETFEQAFTTIYDARLEQLDTLRETFVSLTTTGLLLLVVSGLHLILFQTGGVGDNIFQIILRAKWVLMAGLLFALLQMGAWYLFTLVIPHEELFAKHGFNTDQAIDLRRSWIFAAILGTVEFLILMGLFIFLGTSWLIDNWNYIGLLVIAALASPLLAPAMLTIQEETRVRRRDDAFPEFIRAFGGTAQARAQEPSAMIKALAGIDFGALDASIANLEKRLSMRINSDFSWNWFAADNNSMLVSRFTRVFIEGSSSTGEAGLVGDLVSQSTTTLLGLRQRRQISAQVMRSVSYGLLIAMIVALNITTSIIAGLGETIAEVAAGLVDSTGQVGTASGGVDVALPVLAETGGVQQNIELFQFMGSFLIVISIIVLGLITARIRGGGTTLVLGQMIQMMWVAGIANFFSAWILTQSVGLFQTG